MKRLIYNMIKFVGYLIFCPILAIYYSLKYMVTGTSILGRIIILGAYAGIVMSIIYKPGIAKFIVAALLLIDLLFIILLFVFGGQNSDKEKNENTENGSNEHSNRKSSASEKNPFFEGMTFEEAKREYRKLMKKYHPDNLEGSLEMTLKVAEAYENFCMAAGVGKGR